jgi:hypothetical protein
MTRDSQKEDLKAKRLEEDMAILKEAGHLSFTSWLTETRSLRAEVSRLRSILAWELCSCGNTGHPSSTQHDGDETDGPCRFLGE